MSSMFHRAGSMKSSTASGRSAPTPHCACPEPSALRTAFGSICRRTTTWRLSSKGIERSLTRFSRWRLEGIERSLTRFSRWWLEESGRRRSRLAQVDDKRRDAYEVESHPIADLPVAKHDLLTGRAANDQGWCIRIQNM